MLEFTKTVINSFNRFKYLKNIQRVEINSDTNSLVDDNDYLKDIKNLEIYGRANNLEALKNSYVKLRIKRFWIVSLPAMLVAMSFASIPLHPKTKEGTASVYEKDYSLYNPKLGEYKTTETGYYLSSDTLSPKNANYENMVVWDAYDISNKLKFKMYDEKDSMVATFGIHSDDKLSNLELDTGEYVGLTDYSNYEFGSASIDYDMLLETIIETIKTSSDTNADELAVLERLTASEKANIIIEVQKFIKTESVDVLVKKKNYMSLILFIISLFYIVIEIAVLNDREIKDEVFSYNEVVNKAGELILEEQAKDISILDLIYCSIDAKEKFIAAERDRIQEIATLVKKSIVESDRDKIFTKYEKKLLKKGK